MSEDMSSDEILNYLDWENDEGWLPLRFSTGAEDEAAGIDWARENPPIEVGGWGLVTHVQIVPAPGSLSVKFDGEEAVMKPDHSLRNTLIVMVAVSIPFWLLAGYGLYCLVRR